MRATSGSAGYCLKATTSIDAAFGSHNLRSLAHAIVAAKEIGVPPNGYEIQMLYGMAEPVRQAIIQNGQRVRVYLPVGRSAAGHLLSDSPLDGEHVEHIIFAPDLRRPRRHRRIVN